MKSYICCKIQWRHGKIKIWRHDLQYVPQNSACKTTHQTTGWYTAQVEPPWLLPTIPIYLRQVYVYRELRVIIANYAHPPTWPDGTSVGSRGWMPVIRYNLLPDVLKPAAPSRKCCLVGQSIITYKMTFRVEKGSAPDIFVLAYWVPN